MARACSTRTRKKVDPALRRSTFLSALFFGVCGLLGGAYFGYNMVTHDMAIAAPAFEKFFLTTFISFSCAAAGVILGGFLGSTLYRIFRKTGVDACPPDGKQ